MYYPATTCYCEQHEQRVLGNTTFHNRANICTLTATEETVWRFFYGIAAANASLNLGIYRLKNPVIALFFTSLKQPIMQGQVNLHLSHH